MVVHTGRLLLLIGAFSGPTAALRGLPKLARLDFLLRFPVILEAFLDSRGRPLEFKLRATYYERHAPEAAQVRWKYGPWDHRYYPLLGRLVSQRLIEADSSSGVLLLRVSDRGKAASEALKGDGWELVRARARALRKGADLSVIASPL